MYNGVDGVFTYTFEYEQKSTCAVCASNVFTYELGKDSKLQTLVENLADDPKLYLFFLSFVLLSLIVKPTSQAISPLQGKELVYAGNARIRHPPQLRQDHFRAWN